MWHIVTMLGTLLFGLGAFSGLAVAGFSVVEGDFATAAMMAVFAAGLAWGARACRLDWRREAQRRTEER